jgi:hypothetical protein
VFFAPQWGRGRIRLQFRSFSKVLSTSTGDPCVTLLFPGVLCNKFAPPLLFFYWKVQAPSGALWFKKYKEKTTPFMTETGFFSRTANFGC